MAKPPGVLNSAYCTRMWVKEQTPGEKTFVQEAELCYNTPAIHNTDHIQIDPIPVDEEDNDPVGQPI